MATRLHVNEKIVGSTYEEAKRELLENAAFRQEWEAREAAVEFGRLARQMRTEAGLSQAQLAKELNVTQPLIARLESSHPERTPTLDTMARLARACRRRMVVIFRKEEMGDDRPLLIAE
jgi:DNA-binding XRE family transcriptional regulator